MRMRAGTNGPPRRTDHSGSLIYRNKRVGEESLMKSSIRVMVRRMMGSPTGGLVVTAVVLAATLPWLADRRRHIPAPA
jgi:hypothetical protein